MTDKIAEIAGKLTEAQGQALQGIYPWASPADEWEGEGALYRLGLWNPRPKYSEKVITPLGIAVRNHIRGDEG